MYVLLPYNEYIFLAFGPKFIDIWNTSYWLFSFIIWYDILSIFCDIRGNDTLLLLVLLLLVLLLVLLLLILLFPIVCNDLVASDATVIASSTLFPQVPRRTASATINVASATSDAAEEDLVASEAAVIAPVAEATAAAEFADLEASSAIDAVIIAYSIASVIPSPVFLAVVNASIALFAFTTALEVAVVAAIA